MILGAPVSSDPRSLWAVSVGHESARVSRSGSGSALGADGASNSARTSAGATDGLTPEEQRVVRQLEQTDREVRAHEQAHLSVGADLVRSGPSYSYEVGPDDKRYAVGGEVSIDTSPGKTPEETIPKAQHIRSTALAPADPSAQDFRVAAAASQMEIDARMELAQQRSEEIRSGGKGGGGVSSYGPGQFGLVDDHASDRIGSFLDAFA